MSTVASHAHPGRARRNPGGPLARRARLAFRRWRRNRPFWAGWWALLGGGLMAYVPGTAFRFVLFPGQQLWAGILVGVLVAGFGLLLWFQPQLRVLLGVLIAVLSLVSFVTSDFGGLFVGMLMGLLGGSLAIGWMADPPPSRRERRRHLLAVGGGQAPAVIDLRDASASPAEPSTGLPRPRPAPAEEHPGTEGIRGAADATGPAAPPGD